jgi:heme exporter protein B
MDVSIKSFGLFVLTLVLGNFGLASVMTIIAALISKSSSKGTLYPVLSFPLLLPLILTAINSTRLTIEGTDFGGLVGEIQIMVSYSIVLITASFMLFGLIWND